MIDESGVQPKLFDMVMASIELANCVQDDIKEQGYISDDTVLALNAFMLLHTELNAILDFENYALKLGKRGYN